MSEVERIFDAQEVVMSLVTIPVPSVPHTAPHLGRRHRVRLVRAAPTLWRVLEPAGRVIGHIQSLECAEGVRYRARRFHAASRALVDLGDFWSPDDAVDTLEFAR